MSQFLKRVLSIFSISLGGLMILYFVSDPFKILKPFSLDYFDTINRDYLSSELFLLNYPEQQYDSYIFSSSRGCGINSYHWAKYLPDGSKPFVFQAWSETITGIDQKITYIDCHGLNLKNALVLVDIPGSFSTEQLPTETLSIKDPKFSLQPEWLFHLRMFFNFCQKPSQWIKALRSLFEPPSTSIGFDVVSNDWSVDCRNLDISVAPKKDSLINLSRRAKDNFLHDLAQNDYSLRVCSPLIDGEMELKLKHIKALFDRNQTVYSIIITPGYCYSYPSISPDDLFILESIFGKDNVFDYSKKNELNSDYNNFSDPNHFGQFVGWHIIEDIYGTDNCRYNND